MVRRTCCEGEGEAGVVSYESLDESLRLTYKSHTVSATVSCLQLGSVLLTMFMSIVYLGGGGDGRSLPILLRSIAFAQYRCTYTGSSSGGVLSICQPSASTRSNIVTLSHTLAALFSLNSASLLQINTYLKSYLVALVFTRKIPCCNIGGYRQPVPLRGFYSILVFLSLRGYRH